MVQVVDANVLMGDIFQGLADSDMDASLIFQNGYSTYVWDLGSDDTSLHTKLYPPESNQLLIQLSQSESNHLLIRQPVPIQSLNLLQISLPHTAHVPLIIPNY